jgi:hypothetical protein
MLLTSPEERHEPQQPSVVGGLRLRASSLATEFDSDNSEFKIFFE